MCAFSGINIIIMFLRRTSVLARQLSGIASTATDPLVLTTAHPHGVYVITYVSVSVCMHVCVILLFAPIDQSHSSLQLEQPIQTQRTHRSAVIVA